MNIRKTTIDDLLIIEPRVFADKRGYFFESYNKKQLENSGLTSDFVQDNQSKSSYGVIRGLHFQNNPHSQSKLVRVLSGMIYDVAVDLRKNSPTYLQWFGLEISEVNKLQLFVPKGFAHGFSVLSDETVVMYKCDEFYHPESESGIIYNDPQLKIDWKVPEKEMRVSEKDAILPSLDEAELNF